ncbi:flavodoxin family protein [Roseibium denhamense]|uniref:NADPH-quinone reductase (Modulator of drug activity B) n=1 Tax=Roseibium denhamense TaxID=76305 RepID=A0ABY1N5P8_9HYPH|nr:NAD(P)H-dependent oxidoreductase [Roseibium denhamense]MTI04366.1 flavodoxin family protein [Roseibium denhamense]SMP00859.1 Putative NADPH-quinone reductase (modulator of drug activity B) [Roseibium denhamense]
MVKILVLNGHPAKKSFCGALAQGYTDSARTHGHEVRVQQVSALRFDSDFGVSSFRDAKPWEPDLEAFWQNLEWCDHLVLTHPLWWGGMPAKLKGLIDRVFLPGLAFQYVKGKPLPEKLLKGRTSEVLVSSDTPGWFFRWVYGAGIKKQTKMQILDFCGLKMKRYSWFSTIRGSSEAEREKMLERARKLGAKPSS